MVTDSTTAAKLWGKIMNQLQRAKEGSYPTIPSNVIAKNGQYYTYGTEPDDPPPKKKDKDKDKDDDDDGKKSDSKKKSGKKSDKDDD
jgi:penicillin-binding protein 1A